MRSSPLIKDNISGFERSYVFHLGVRCDYIISSPLDLLNHPLVIIKSCAKQQIPELPEQKIHQQKIVLTLS